MSAVKPNPAFVNPEAVPVEPGTPGTTTTTTTTEQAPAAEAPKKTTTTTTDTDVAEQ